MPSSLYPSFLPSHLSLSCHPTKPESCLLSFSLRPATLSPIILGSHLSLTCTGDHFTPQLCLFCLFCHSLSVPLERSQITQLSMRKHPPIPPRPPQSQQTPSSSLLTEGDEGETGSGMKRLLSSPTSCNSSKTVSYQTYMCIEDVNVTCIPLLSLLGKQWTF